MILIGFMHFRKKPTNKAYAFAAVAKIEGAELLYFSPGMVDFEKRTINGYMYHNGEWTKTLSKFPDVICNVTGFTRDSQNETVERLSTEIPFTSFPIGSKATVYKNILRYNEFADYLVPTEVVNSEKHFFELLDKYGEVVFKPSMGCQGTDVYYVKKGEVPNQIAEKIASQEFLVQPYINCRTKSGDAYDLRLHVQKDKNAKWVLTKIYPRIAESGSIVCNLARGGSTTGLTLLLQREFGERAQSLQKTIEIFALQLAAHMDKIQSELYNEELDELGIDVGLDDSQKIWIYEINWRPGYPPSMNLDLNIVKNTIGYAMHLAGKRRA